MNTTAPEQGTSPIRLDESDAFILVHCTDHPYWRAMRFYLDDAKDAACAHEDEQHPKDYRQREARRKRTRRRVVSAGQA